MVYTQDYQFDIFANIVPISSFTLIPQVSIFLLLYLISLQKMYTLYSMPIHPAFLPLFSNL